MLSYTVWKNGLINKTDFDDQYFYQSWGFLGSRLQKSPNTELLRLVSFSAEDNRNLFFQL